jgi:hypothetical protein
MEGTDSHVITELKIHVMAQHRRIIIDQYKDARRHILTPPQTPPNTIQRHHTLPEPTSQSSSIQTTDLLIFDPLRFYIARKTEGE